MFLADIHRCNYDKDIAPFIKNGVIIDTSVIKKIIDGLIETKITKRESPELDKILSFLDLIKLSGKWESFFITPHILTEVCRHLRDDYAKPWGNDFYKAVETALPILKAMDEKTVSKCNFLEQIDKKKPVIEAGDISIFVTTNNFIAKKEKIAILVDDRRIKKIYEYHPHVMIMDYQSVMLNA
ncbi:MAG: hypothetical protein Q8N09_11540 [Thermodesulfovibrionia bacterium]|nr:hypothetical protein [Thermodesulfovibrionia bacterium]